MLCSDNPCTISNLAAKFAFFPPVPATYTVKKDENTGRVTASRVPRDPFLDVLLLDTKRGNKIVAFYLRNPLARLTVLYSHGNAADLGQLYDLFVQLKINLRINLIGLVPFFVCFSIPSLIYEKNKEQRGEIFFWFPFWVGGGQRF